MSLNKGYFRMGLDCSIDWPSKERTVCFQGHILTLEPETDTWAPSVMVKVEGEFTQQKARQLIQEFLSALAWAKRGGVSETFSTCCSGASLHIGKGTGRMISDSPIEYVPDPSDPKAKLALALYREALSVNMIPYKFLGFFKVINVLHRKGRGQEGWINDNLVNVGGRDFDARLKELREEPRNIGKHLVTLGRNAVAHAFSRRTVNPDDPKDLLRLGADLPLIKALAEYAIEHELGVKSTDTVDREHLYELEGFRKLFGGDIVQKLKGGEEVPLSQLPIPKRLSLRLRGREQLTSFENMDAQIAFVEKGTVGILLKSSDTRIEARVLLSFVEECLTFDAIEHLCVHDDGSREAAASGIDALRFYKGWQVNGVNEIWDTSTGRRLGRSQPVFLVNMRPNWNALDQEIADLESRISETSCE